MTCNLMSQVICVKTLICIPIHHAVTFILCKLLCYYVRLIIVDNTAVIMIVAYSRWGKRNDL